MKKLGLYLLRGGTVAASLAVGAIAFFTFLQVVAVNGLNVIDIALSLLILVSTVWLAWGGMQGIIGLTTSAKRPTKRGAEWIKGRTVVLMPVYNEDPLMSFTRPCRNGQVHQTSGCTSQYPFRDPLGYPRQ